MEGTGSGARGSGWSDWSHEWDGDGTGSCLRVLQPVPPSLPCGCPMPESSGEARGKQLLYPSCPGPGAFARPPRGSVHSHVLTSTANSTGPIVLPSHHLLHERSQLRLPLVGEICSTNKTSALSLPVLPQQDPPALPPHGCSRGREGARGRNQRQAGEPGAGTRGQHAGGTFQLQPRHGGTCSSSVSRGWTPQHQRVPPLCPSPALGGTAQSRGAGQSPAPCLLPRRPPAPLTVLLLQQLRARPAPGNEPWGGFSNWALLHPFGPRSPPQR